jgi:predicted metalloprotease
MRWKGRRGSENVEDRRSIGGPAVIVGGGGLLLLGIIILLMCMGADPRMLFEVAKQFPQQPVPAPQQQPRGEA